MKYFNDIAGLIEELIKQLKKTIQQFETKSGARKDGESEINVRTFMEPHGQSPWGSMKYAPTPLDAQALPPSRSPLRRA